ncbi:MAG: flavodoxin domain-containing protein [Longimicrobiales bacterium]|nr:flavodoxin domain-containing protein [Longimicrobiales bacterium]
MIRRLRPSLLLALASILVPCSALGQNVVVVYFSATGHTKAMAEAVAEGARGVAGSDVRLLTVGEATRDDLLWADAVLVGSPVRTANVAPEVAAFINGMPFGGEMADKVGAAFVTGGGISAGEELTQVALLHSMLVYGMVVVGGPEWTGAFGASAITGEPPFSPDPAGSLVDERFLAKGRGLGRRAAEVAARLRR